MLAVVTLLSLLGQPDDNKGPLTVEQTLWGYGSAVPMTFNQVSLQVRNDGKVPFDGRLAIELSDRVRARNQPHDAVVRELYLSPGETRWVPFGVFLVDGGAEWEAVTLDGDGAIIGRSPLTQPRFREPGVVAVVDESSAAKVPVLDADRFPTKSTLLDGFYAVILPDDPKWQPGQERAFDEWIRQGGRVVLGSRATNWSPTLASLGKPLPDFTIGCGRVIRSENPLELTEDEVRDAFRGISIPEGGETTHDPWGRRRLNSGKYAWDADGEVFLSLNEIATPSSLALLFYPMVVVYVGVVGWISWRSSKERWRIRRYVVSLVITVASAIVVFAFASPLSGQLATQCVGLTFAIDLGDSSNASDAEEGRELPRLDLTTYAVFRVPFPMKTTNSVPNSDVVETRLISVGSPLVRSRIDDGPIQAVSTAIQGVTNIAVRSRQSVLNTPPRWSVSAITKGAELQPENALAKELRPLAALVQVGHSVNRMSLEKDKQLRGRQPLVMNDRWISLRDFLVNPSMDDRLYELNGFAMAASTDTNDDARLKDAAGKALPAFHQLTGAIEPVTATLPEGVYRLFVLTETPESFHPDEPFLPRGSFYTVWCSQQVYQPRDAR